VELANQGRHAQALELLRAARSEYAGSELLPELLLQSSRSARASGEEFRARWFLTEVLRLSPESAVAAVAGGELAELLAADHRYEEALEALRAASRAAERTGAVDPQPLLLRASEVAALYLDDRAAAWQLVSRVDARLLGGEQRRTYDLVVARARWAALPSSTFGLADPNVSALAVDGGDLWVGTWNGGLSRYTRSEGTSEVFRAGENSLVASTVRAICPTARHVWVGTDQGLSQYSKALAKWRTVEEFGGSKPRKVQAIREHDGLVYVATLGDGLWVLDGDRWARAAEADFGTAYLTCLASSSLGLLVGTMDHGLFVLSGGRARSASAVGAPAPPSRNVTAALEDAAGTVWVATYGDGLWEWRPGEGLLHWHGLASGELADDWVMCITQTRAGLYFGTFGGGVSVLAPGGGWSRFGLGDGLAGLDVTVAVPVGRAVWFGTLGAGLSVYHEGLEP
jgi:ligand-binding sensor domain-containing protein